MTTPTPRQRIYVSTHLTEQSGPFRPELHPADADQVIARLDLIDGLAIQSADASIFRRLADFCLRAANTIEAALAEQARREAATDMKIDAQAEADAEARALGYHDTDCQAEHELDALHEELADL